MRLMPHRIYLMALEGIKTLHGRALPSMEDAALALRRLTGQDFGHDTEKWSAWIKANRKGLYGRKKSN